MARMAGNMGAILAVSLLGCTRTCRMVQASLTVRLNRSNRTVRTGRGQPGTLPSASSRPTGTPRLAAVAGSETRGMNPAGRECWGSSWPVS
jgi:hypothetical protein